MKLPKLAKLLIAPVLVLGVVAAGAALMNGSAYAVDVCSLSDVPADVKAAAGCDTASPSLASAIVSILNAVIGIAGVIAVIFVVVGGVTYITSAGDSSKLEKAKKTILYAVIGLVICALAFAIVNFVIKSVLKQGASGGDEPETDGSETGETALVISEPRL